MGVGASFPDFIFSTAATQEHIESAQNRLRVAFPEQLCELYREANGFSENLGLASYLYPLDGEEAVTSLVSTTEFYWNNVILSNVRVTDYIFFGSSSADETFGIEHSGNEKVIAYHHNMEGEAEILAGNILDVYKSDLAKYEV